MKAEDLLTLMAQAEYKELRIWRNYGRTRVYGRAGYVDITNPEKPSITLVTGCKHYRENLEGIIAQWQQGTVVPLPEARQEIFAIAGAIPSRNQSRYSQGEEWCFGAADEESF